MAPGIKVTNKDDDSATKSIAVDATDGFVNGDGSFRVSEAYFTDPINGVIAVPSGWNYVILNTNLITVDDESPVVTGVTTGDAYDSSKKQTLTGTRAKANSIKVQFRDDGKNENDGAGSGLDASSVTPSDFTVANNSVQATLVVGTAVYLTLGDNLGSEEKPTVNIANGAILDKAGNAYAGGRERSSDNLGPNLSLSKDVSLSNDDVTVTITTDERLGSTPEVWVTAVNDDGLAPAMASDAEGNRLEGNVSSVRPSGALSYTFVYDAPDGDGEYSVYVVGEDTGGTENDVGHASNPATSSAFTFEIDSVLNENNGPIVSVASNEDVKMDTSEVEQVDPMIVTVAYTDEAGEYKGDSYRTVELTSAELVIRYDDGTSDTINFNLTTEVRTSDNIKFTIPLLNPKIGSYTLTVEAVDQAGNEGEASESWEVVAPSPVNIEMAPGWNLISLPFQPANPAINSVINASHPADIVMTFDNATQVWLVSRRDAESGLFVGDITVMTASTAYFIRTENFQAIRMLRPPLATAAAAPPPPPAITVVKGWNLVPIVSNAAPTPSGVAADEYFGTLGGGGSNDGWLKALTFDTLSRIWVSVTPGERVQLSVDDINACTGKKPSATAVGEGTEACQISVNGNLYAERSSVADDIVLGQMIPDETTEDDTDERPATEDDVTKGPDGDVDAFDANDKVTVRAAVEVGKGYWLYSTVDGVIIP